MRAEARRGIKNGAPATVRATTVRHRPRSPRRGDGDDDGDGDESDEDAAHRVDKGHDGREGRGRERRSGARATMGAVGDIIACGMATTIPNTPPLIPITSYAIFEADEGVQKGNGWVTRCGGALFYRPPGIAGARGHEWWRRSYILSVETQKCG